MAVMAAPLALVGIGFALAISTVTAVADALGYLVSGVAALVPAKTGARPEPVTRGAAS